MFLFRAVLEQPGPTNRGKKGTRGGYLPTPPGLLRKPSLPQHLNVQHFLYFVLRKLFQLC